MIVGPISPNPTTGALQLGDTGYTEPQALFVDSAGIGWLRTGFTLWPGSTGTARVRVEVEYDGLHVTIPADVEVEHAHDAIGTAATPMACMSVEHSEPPPFMGATLKLMQDIPLDVVKTMLITSSYVWSDDQP